LLSAACAPARPEEAAPALKVAVGPPSATVHEGARLLIKYNFGDVPFKPYVVEFPTPGGFNPLRDQVADHKHHHALMFAVAADGVNFWEETPKCGKQVHRGFAGSDVRQRGGASEARFTETLDWAAPDGTVLMQEERTIRVHRAAGLDASLLTWETKLRPGPGKESVVLGGSHYYGLGMRFLASMDKTGTFLLADEQAPATTVRGDETLRPSAWCAYAVKGSDGKASTSAMFDHPGNARPALWFTMKAAFAYQSATLNYWKEPLTVKAAEPLVLRYGVASWDGEAGRAAIAAMRERWLALARE
jgi:hypothetical protein